MAGKKLINRWLENIALRWQSWKTRSWHSWRKSSILAFFSFSQYWQREYLWQIQRFNIYFHQPRDCGGRGPRGACHASPWASAPARSSGGCQGTGESTFWWPAWLLVKNIISIGITFIWTFVHKLRKDSFQIEKGKVALISGGGSGHEPFCAGYIGEIRDISEILVDILVRQVYMDIYIYNIWIYGCISETTTEYLT